MLKWTTLALLHCATALDGRGGMALELSKNPIRRVVNLLQSMQKKIEQEAVRDAKTHSQFGCYCRKQTGELTGSIAAADVKIPQVATAIKEAESTKEQLEQALKDHQVARAEAKASIDKATQLRKKEAAAFAKESGDYKTNIGALSSAISAISKGMAGSFLQGSTARVIRQLAVDAGELSEFDRQSLVSFLSGKSDEGYAPQSGQIVGILKEMLDDMSKNLADITATEESSIASYKELVAAKGKEIAANTKAIETKTVRVGNLGVEIAQLKNDLDDTQAALLDDQKFLADMEKNCAAKAADWDKIVAERNQELAAIAETIKLLSEDDALELFKKTLPSASFVQVSSHSARAADDALALVHKVRGIVRKEGRAALDLIGLALTGKKVSFEKVIKLIDELVATLHAEQQDDEDKKEYCEKQLDTTEDKKKGLSQDVKDLQLTEEEATEKLSTLTSEIKALTAEIKALDKEVVEIGATRQEEHATFLEEMASNKGAKDLLELAKNRMNKFYNPKLYKPPPKKVLTEEERISKNLGGEAFMQVRAHHQREAPAAAPVAVGPYQRQGQESNGVIVLLDRLIADLVKEMTEAGVVEQNAQKEYESYVGDAAVKRSASAKSLTDKEGAKANTEATLQETKEGKVAKTKELMATEAYMASLHSECDWLQSNFALRKEARAGEIDSLLSAPKDNAQCFEFRSTCLALVA